ncbi:MAG TPA: hypothetical protein VES69_10160, partial [Pyrinomonadaceae bacterium]|nr:hypothetical protein [Pyrinomonadaceae bacterium]
ESMTTTDSVFQRALSNMLMEIFDGPLDLSMVLEEVAVACIGDVTAQTPLTRITHRNPARAIHHS